MKSNRIARLVLVASFVAIISSEQSSAASVFCIPSEKENGFVKSVGIDDEYSKDFYTVSVERTSGESEAASIKRGDLEVQDAGDFSAVLNLSGKPRVLKETGAYTNLEVLTLQKKGGEFFLLQGRTCDPYYQEEEGCLDSTVPLEVASVKLMCAEIGR